MKKLVARDAPGRSNRKARAFVAEIARLRAEGHGLVAIQQALADAGVVVGVSTVRREVMRLGKAPPTPRPQPFAPPTQDRLADPSAFKPPEPLDAYSFAGREGRSSKDIAADFAERFSTNPLMRLKEARESPGD